MVAAAAGFVKKPPAVLMVGTVAADALLPTVERLLSGVVAPPLNHAFNWSLSVNEVSGDGVVSLLL